MGAGFHLIDVLSLWGPLEFLTAIVVGVQVGMFYAYPNRLGISIWHKALLGNTFFIALAALRWAEGVDTWERSIGLLLLWPLYCVGMKSGYNIRAWLARR